MKTSTNQILMRAKSILNKGNIEEAEILFNSVLEKFPKNKRARAGLNEVYNKAKSTQNLQMEIREAARLLSNGDPSKSAQKCEYLINKFPENPQILDIIGCAYKRLGRLQEAEEFLSQAVEIAPNSYRIFNNLAAVFIARKKFDHAIEAYRNSLSINPHYSEAHYGIAKLLLKKKNTCEAIKHYELAIHNNSENSDAIFGLADVFAKSGDLDKSIELYKKGLEIKPKKFKAVFNLANSLKSSGKLSEAISLYQLTMETNPEFGACYAEATALKGFPINSDLKSKVIKALNKGNHSKENERHIKFALFNICDRLEQYEEAFEWLTSAVELRRQEIDYDIKEDHILFTKIYNAAPPYLKNYKFLNKSPKTPIFIVGMPRSGTTLTEQIISSHSQVYGFGELGALAKAALPLIEKDNFNLNNINIIRDKYLKYILRKSGESLFTTDKMPHNFRFLPMICASLPEAKIVHIFRDSKATCWSNLSRNFRSNKLGYSCNLENVVEYYNMYSLLMQEWSRVLGDRIFHLRYESLVEDQMSKTRQLLDYIGLDWQDAVMSPHKNEKNVLTASAEQVRQPIYKNSSEKWMHYEKYVRTAFAHLKQFEEPR